MTDLNDDDVLGEPEAVPMEIDGVLDLHMFPPDQVKDLVRDYIDECLEGTFRLMQSDCSEPLNIGSSEMISINGLAHKIIALSNKRIGIRHIDGPLGVRGRNSDNTLIKKVLGWEPEISLRTGLAKTYRWIEEQIEFQERGVKVNL